MKCFQFQPTHTCHIHTPYVCKVGWGWLLRVKDQVMLFRVNDQVMVFRVVGRPSQLMDDQEHKRRGKKNKNALKRIKTRFVGVTTKCVFFSFSRFGRAVYQL